MNSKNNIKINNTNEFGKRLKEIRRSKGLTQQALAEKANIDEKHLCRIENGRYFPSYITLSKILSALEVSIQDTGLSLDEVKVNNNPYIEKAMQILNTAKNEKELSCYVEALKVVHKAINIGDSESNHS